MLAIHDLCKTFAKGTVNEHTALDHIDLEVGAGEFVTLIGSNGAGKSTLFGAIAGTFQPDAGAIVLDGADITFLPEHKRARRIGTLFQDPMRGTAPDMTIEENLSLAYGRGHRFPLGPAVRKQDRALFMDALREFGMGLEDRMTTKVGVLSGGQRQAMTLLMATIASPRLLLLDEHTAALDPATAEKVLRVTMDVVRKRKLTTLMITHNMVSALSVGTRTLMLDKGKILLDISGEERARMTVDDLLAMYHLKAGETLANDRMLLTQRG